MDEVSLAFQNIQGKINGLGLENTSTLIQEYLSGTEYVVDTVSRHGHHKVVAVWEYDKRPVNGAPFVYFGVRLVDPDKSQILVQTLSDYVLRVLEALDISHGPGHAEVKLVHSEPCLIEIGARCHGGEGSYVCIVDRCVGYNQVVVTVDAYVNPEAFDALPDIPTNLSAVGCEAMLVSYDAGILESVSGLARISTFSSFLQSQVYLEAGDEVHRTVDMFTTPGSIMLVHEDPTELERDYQEIRKLETSGQLLRLTQDEIGIAIEK